jgi:hypothetical protein
MKLQHLVPVALAVCSSSAFGSALIQRDDTAGVIRYISQLNYTGPAATPENALDSAEEISRMWNESNAKVVLDGRTYRTEFVISYTLNRYIPWFTDRSCGENHILVKNMEHADDRSNYEVSGSDGTFYTSDDLGHSSTAAHEYGHGLGLQHNDGDQGHARVPGIMFARGTRVAPRFQYDPHAHSGAAGGTVNPVLRHVRAEDVAQIDLSHIHFIYANGIGYGCVGGGQPLRIALHNRVPLHPLSHSRSPHEMAVIAIQNAIQYLTDESNIEI